MINWKKIFYKEKKKKYFINIKNFLKNEYKKKIIFPQKKNIFQLFKLIEFNKIKVVILGQDPYCNINQAHGLAFSVLPNIKKLPKSLINIYKELKYEFNNFKIPSHGYLINWVKQGVFLFNTILTVEKNKPCSHKNIGWEIFSNNIIKYINFYLKNIIFILWGKYAQKKIHLINKQKHFILTSSHPSPLSASKGFFGCNHFKKTNIYLKQKNISPIIW